MSPDRVTSRRAALRPELHLLRTEAETGLRWISGDASRVALVLAREIVEAQNPIPPKIPISYYAVESVLHNWIERELLRRHFYGRTGERMAVVIPPDPEDLSKNPDDFPPDLVRSFIGFIALSSTGRGRVGAFSYKASLGLKDAKSLADDLYIQPKFKVAIKAINAKDIDQMMTDSQFNWAQNVSNGIRTAFSGGLPSLGRRSR
ncbi:MAG TPA: hypothetical protein VMR77_03550 [Patescibacteria group bacterium]|jgi:hypothetical protein|nr:hypothetical protein [Patescibacteria group bacterium]